MNGVDQQVQELTANDFAGPFKAKLIAAYPVIADMTADEAYFADAAERDAAFERVLASRHVGPICRQAYRDDLSVRTQGRDAAPSSPGAAVARADGAS